MTQRDKALALQALHEAPEILVLVNAWDVASARVVAALPGCRAVGTASAAVSESAGYPDGELMPVDLVLANLARICAAVDLPVTADLESGYGDITATVTEAIRVGAVGANLEDGMLPLDAATIGARGAPSPAELQAMGVTRVSFGPWGFRAAMAEFRRYAQDRLVP
jgi:2-methylisocitrate lyase-like PEP mutase family enzyme